MRQSAASESVKEPPPPSDVDNAAMNHRHYHIFLSVLPSCADASSHLGLEFISANEQNIAFTIVYDSFPLSTQQMWL